MVVYMLPWAIECWNLVSEKELKYYLAPKNTEMIPDVEGSFTKTL